MYGIGLDIGTTKICAVLVNARTGMTEHVQSVANNFNIFGNSFEHKQDASNIIAACKELLDGLIDRSHDIAAIGLTGQMHGIVYADGSNKAVSPLYTWQDARGQYVSKEIQGITGKKTPPGYGLATHFYNVRHGLAVKDAVKLTTIHSLAAACFSGSEPVLHASDAASLGLYDIREGIWDFTSINKLGMELSLLPSVTTEAKILGRYRGIPVCCAIGDNQASFLGSAADGQTALINIGTGSQISIPCGKNTVGEKPLELRPLDGGYNLLAGCPLCGGSAFAVLKTFVESTLNLCGAANPGGIYDLLNDAGYEADGSLICDTRFRGTRENSEIRGAIQNITPENFTVQNLSYAFLHGMVRELYDLYTAGEMQARRLVGTGNAIRRTPLLRKIIRDMFSLPLYIPKHIEEAAFGACLLALKTAGALNTADVAKLIQYEEI